MSKRFVTIVSDQKGGFSFHTSWKSACETYGWEATPRVPSEHEGHSIKKAPLDVQIKCLELVEFLHRKEISQSYSPEDGDWAFEVSGYDTEYQIICVSSICHEPADYHHGDRGAEMMSPAFDYYELKEVIKVELITEDGPVEITIDEWTAEQILDRLDFNENVEE